MSSVIFEIGLGGLYKINKINAYYTRDITMNINNSEHIVQSLKKLCYYEINENCEEEAYVKSKIISWIKTNSYTNIVNTNLSDFISDVRNSPDFLQFKVRLTQRLERANNLNVHKNDTDTYNFYSNLTIEELHYLGH